MNINLADPQSFSAAVPHEEFERLRREAPVHWTPTPSGAARGGFWSLTRYADIVNASRAPETFSNSKGICYPVRSGGAEGAHPMADNVIYNDPPRHTEIRSLVAAAFTKRMVSRFAGWITEVVDTIVDDLHGRGSCDLVPLVAVELPARVICSVIGVPLEQRSQVVAWTNDLFSREDPNGGAERADAALRATMAYAVEMRYAQSDSADTSMIKELAVAERDGAKISDSMYQQLVMSLLTAGFETTHTLIGQSMRLILENPDIEAQAYAAARAGDTVGLVEEFLRYVTPAMHMARHATHDVVLHDTEIKAGDTVLLWHVSANRDAEVVDRPHTFDSARSRHPHQSFGAGGPHFCIGNQLARLEVQILLRELLTRGPKITLDGTPERGWSVFINQLRSLPVVCQ
ncbi:conserved hypothetical protein [Frankia canadensis]|uniref:Cytochrome P450 n=1 Tax=Frankia canadensis TaxID=1836972 RepID=A0A2I2KI08_9ACTN|nr:cytochrome P450 [Frankia canadensis]SNQ45301.1 conserved hypothetical protein [Frankia canadensis]SOU52591.1 conserved hypothetical protein [Frankia canadensis]